METLNLSCEGEKIVHMKLVDTDYDDKILFAHKCAIEEFDQTSGHKKIDLVDPAFEYLGTLEFDYKGNNLVT